MDDGAAVDEVDIADVEPACKGSPETAKVAEIDVGVDVLECFEDDGAETVRSGLFERGDGEVGVEAVELGEEAETNVSEISRARTCVSSLAAGVVDHGPIDGV
jgi:hypothetical protein